MKLTAVLLALASLQTPARAQTLSIDHLTQGATAEFAFSDGVPGGVAVLLAGLGGLGAGACFDADACLGFLPPLFVLETVVIAGDGSAAFALPLNTSLPQVSVAWQVLEASASGPLVDFRTSNAVLQTVAPLSDLGDDFEGGPLSDDWEVLNAHLGTAEVVGGELVLTPNTGGLPNMWFEDGEGLAVVRVVHGDFELSCEILVHAPGNQSAPPPTSYRFGGLLIRDPSSTAPGTHEWCHVATGAGGSGEPAGVEWKETHSSSSQWQVTPTATTHKELRLVRQGNTVTSWYREPGAAVWLALATYQFAALPSSVEVGAMAYSNPSTPNVVARIESLSLDH